jgi:hypothetical protein
MAFTMISSLGMAQYKMDSDGKILEYRKSSNNKLKNAT